MPATLSPPDVRMDDYLQNVQTGDRHPLTPHRTLIGTAAHATARTPPGTPFLAALAVRYDDGWAVHALSDDPGVTFNRTPFRIGQQVSPRADDVLAVGDSQFRFVGNFRPPWPSTRPSRPPACCAFVSDAEGVEECRVVDHGLLLGRLPVCHVRFADTRLSRVHALLATHAGGWYVHPLSAGPVGRNREAVDTFAPLDDGDELQIGPLTVRVELRPAAPDAASTPEEPVLTPRRGAAGRPEPAWADIPTVTAETAHTSETPEPEALPSSSADRESVHLAGARLDRWLRAQEAAPAAAGSGLVGWLGAQRDRLHRFWVDTPEATSARGHRAAGRVAQAFTVLDRAVRARPDSPGLLRELYRLYEAVGLLDLCYRPLRMIEKLADARGSADTWALETLARLCERLGRQRPSMGDRAVGYWNKLEAATGVSYARERSAAMASRALRDGGFTPRAED